MNTISGQNILLTGGSRGLGPIIAEALGERGANLALTARSEKGLRTTAQTLEQYGINMMIIPADLSKPDQRDNLISTVYQKFRSIDILINNAGLGTEGAYLDLSWEAIQNTIDVNLTAPMALTYQVLPLMLERKHGHIVNIASVGAQIGTAYAALYCGTKAGLVKWTQGLRLELEGSGVNFSTILPGYVTKVGMFARFNKQPPAIIGSCTPTQVALAVVRSIEKNKKEIIVNSTPARLLFLANTLSAALGDWVIKLVGTVDFQREKIKG